MCTASLKCSDYVYFAERPLVILYWLVKILWRINFKILSARYAQQPNHLYRFLVCWPDAILHGIQVAKFLERCPKEIVLLDFNHLYGFHEREDHICLMNMVYAIPSLHSPTLNVKPYRCFLVIRVFSLCIPVCFSNFPYMQAWSVPNERSYLLKWFPHHSLDFWKHFTWKCMCIHM